MRDKQISKNEARGSPRMAKNPKKSMLEKLKIPKMALKKCILQGRFLIFFCRERKHKKEGPGGSAVRVRGEQK